MKIRKYTAFVKINENIEEENFRSEEDRESNFDKVEDLKRDVEEDDDLDNKELSDEDFPEGEEEFEEEDDDSEGEEGGEYIGTIELKRLAKELGTEVVNNAINYEGKTINFFSETESFHVDRKKFKTIPEVIAYLNGDKGEVKSPERHHHSEGHEMPLQHSERHEREAHHESKRILKKFKSF